VNSPSEDSLCTRFVYYLDHDQSFVYTQILGRGNFLMRLDDTKDMVVQALVAQITVDGIIGLDCLRSNAGLIDLQNSILEQD
jgi:hypothetical protein